MFRTLFRLKSAAFSANQLTTALFLISFGITGCGGNGLEVQEIGALSSDVDASADTVTTSSTAEPQEIVFLEATKTSLRVLGSGGDTNSTLSFRVSAANQVISGRSVTFTLSTGTATRGVTFAGGVATGVTNTEGEVTVEIVAGSLPGPVVVSMTVDGSSISPVSSVGVAVEGGPPVGGNFDLTIAESFNPPAWGVSGENLTITASLTDQYGHAVTNDTVVTFVAESGAIDPSCTTTNGQCSVTWSSRVAGQDTNDDTTRRATIMAFTQGSEAYEDIGSQRGAFDDDDTFTDIGDFYLDTAATSTTEANTYNAARAGAASFIIDGNGTTVNVVDEQGDGKYNGPNCVTGSVNCSSTTDTVTLAQSLVIVLSSQLETPTVVGLPASITLNAPGERQTFFAQFGDFASNSLPCGSTVTVETTTGTAEVIGGGSTNCFNIEPQFTSFSLTAAAAGTGGAPVDDGVLQVTITIAAEGGATLAYVTEITVVNNF